MNRICAKFQLYQRTSMGTQKRLHHPHPPPHLTNDRIGRRGVETSIATSSSGEALSTFIRASRDPKGEQQVWVAKSLR